MRWLTFFVLFGDICFVFLCVIHFGGMVRFCTCEENVPHSVHFYVLNRRTCRADTCTFLPSLVHRMHIFVQKDPGPALFSQLDGIVTCMTLHIHAYSSSHNPLADVSVFCLRQLTPNTFLSYGRAKTATVCISLTAQK
jgi:hypothetical protein